MKPNSAFTFVPIYFIVLPYTKKNGNNAILKDNLLYKQGSNIPFTGRERAMVENEIVEYDVKDGYKHGEFRIFSKDGKLQMQGQLDSNRNVRMAIFFPDGKLNLRLFNNDLPGKRLELFGNEKGRRKLSRWRTYWNLVSIR
jgi:antitoxin component YwqK of YwqJK toxin-antitoxin module